MNRQHRLRRCCSSGFTPLQGTLLPFAFTTEASIDLAADQSLMEMMTASGFRRVFLGIETPDQDSLLGAQKFQNIRSPLIDAVDSITAHGLEVMAGFILGFDGEKAGAGDRIVAFVEQTAIPLAMLGILQAFPNTALSQRLAREGRLIACDGEFDEGVQTYLLNFRPTRPMSEIAHEFLAAFAALYEPHNYMRRIFRYSQKLSAGRDASRGIRSQLRPWTQGSGVIRGLLALIWRQGIRRSTRWLFWRQLLAMTMRYPYRLDDYFWLLMLNEHFIDYQSIVTSQIEAQLYSSQYRELDLDQAHSIVQSAQLSPAN